MQLLVNNYYYVCVDKVLHAGIPRRHHLHVVEVEKGSSQLGGSQYQETQEGHAMEENNPQPTTCDDDMTHPLVSNMFSNSFFPVSSSCVVNIVN